MRAVSRRRVLAGGVALPFALRAMAETAARPKWIFLGTDLGEGIYQARWDASRGELGAIELAVETERPTFMARHPTLDVLYATNEVDKGSVSGFAVDGATGALTLLGSGASHGSAPCFVSVAPEGHALFAANYGSGSVACVRLGTEGVPGQVSVAETDALKTGPERKRQDGPHMHCTTVSPDGKFVLACDLGCDAIVVYRIGWHDSWAGGPVLQVASERMSEFGNVRTTPGVGPRHVAFDGSGRWVYCINELDCSVDVYDWKDGVLTARAGDRVSTLAGFQGKAAADGIPNTASEIAVEGGFLYAATRGADVMAVFAIDAATGRLTHVQTVGVGGRIPRHFAIEPGGRFLVCANQGTGKVGTANVAVFRRGLDGRLALVKVYAAESPMFVQFV